MGERERGMKRRNVKKWGERGEGMRRRGDEMRIISGRDGGLKRRNGKEKSEEEEKEWDEGMESDFERKDNYE